MVDITLVSYSIARLWLRVPPSDEGGGAVGDGGRDNDIANQRQILIVHFLRTSFFVASFRPPFSKGGAVEGAEPSSPVATGEIPLIGVSF